MLTPIAMGKIAADGTILKATPGITVTTSIVPGSISGSNIGYKVNLPERLVSDTNYIVQLTAENYFERMDSEYTMIALRYQQTTGFEVLIWANQSKKPTDPGFKIDTIRVPWHFVIYDI